MGPVLAKLRQMFWNQEMEITLVGLNNAGKTTLLNVISDGKAKDTIPTVGLNTRKVQKGNVAIKLWDIGGQTRFRGMWERYCRNVDVIVFVVDSNNFQEADKAKEALMELIKKPALQKIPLLVLGNKSDLEPHMDTEKLKEMLDLESVTREREVAVHPISAKNQVGIDFVFNWLIRHAPKERKS